MEYFDENEINHEQYLHLLWSTKNQKPIITPTIARDLKHYISDLVLSCECNMIGGRVFNDHVQLIVKFPPTFTFSDLISELKTATLLWINTYFPELKDFEWQGSDFSFSICFDDVEDMLVKIDQSGTFSEVIFPLIDELEIECDPREMLD